MTFSLTWQQRLLGVPTNYRGCISDFFNNVLPGLPVSTWSPHGSPVLLNGGLQGGCGVRDSDGLEFCIGNFITGDPTGNGATAPPGGSMSLSADGGGGATNANGIDWVGMNSGAAYFDVASQFMGANGITAIFFTHASRTGFFIRGETLNVAGGTYAATIIECYHDGASNGVLFVGPWTTGTPSATNVTGAALAGVTSLATATVNTASNDRVGVLGWYMAKAQDTYYLPSITGADPTGTITGSTTGFTSTFSAWTPASSGKLEVTAGQGRYLHGELLTWTGGSGVVEHVPFGAEMVSINDLLTPTANETDASGYLVGYDADRLVLLLPNEGSGPTTYKIIAFGKWAEDLRGGGAADCCILSNGVEFPAQTTTNQVAGIIIEPRDGHPMTIASNANNVPTDALMAGAPGALGSLFTGRITAGLAEVTHDASSADFLIASRKMEMPNRFFFSYPAPAAVARPAYVLYGFFTGPTPSGFRALLTHPDGTSRFGVQLDSGAGGLFLNFDDPTIVP